MPPAGLPHSEIRGSKDACSSPRLIAASHVLHRLPAPRHPPCALLRLASLSSPGRGAENPELGNRHSRILPPEPGSRSSKNRPTSHTAYWRSSLPRPVFSISCRGDERHNVLSLLEARRPYPLRGTGRAHDLRGRYRSSGRRSSRFRPGRFRP